MFTATLTSVAEVNVSAWAAVRGNPSKRYPSSPRRLPTFILDSKSCRADNLALKLLKAAFDSVEALLKGCLIDYFGP